MPLDKDTLHVVVRLPFKRPENFVEPPPILWTDEMEVRLWQYMSQKNTDWNFIAEQLGVPTPYLVRHAAFLYETQLRGIQQQLRLSEVSKAPSSATNTPPSSQRRNISTSRSTSSNRQTPTTSFRNSTPPPHPPAPPTAVPVETAGPEDSTSSMMLSAISNIAPRESPVADTPIRANSPLSGSSSQSSQLHPSGSSASSSIHKNSFLRTQSSMTPRQSQRTMDQHSPQPPSNASRPPSRQQDATPSSVTSQMASLHLLQQDEEPAFLPSKSRPSSRLLPSLRQSQSRSLDKGKGRQLQPADFPTGSTYDTELTQQSAQRTAGFPQQQKEDSAETIRSRILEASDDIRQSSTRHGHHAHSAQSTGGLVEQQKHDPLESIRSRILEASSDIRQPSTTPATPMTASRTPPESREPPASSQPAFLSRTMPPRQADMSRPLQSTTHLAGNP
ncbi:hypothetical protein BCR43DRAFT_451523 [Syncephalastrum racemosum]|uniref:Autophagy-related protein 29 n=1 Tax=Syncephalastrum racemosum TaxID=13706 RepID=A0A1X2HWJ6_SYNRA|nr:hypothetical protein BCR43DRAFT_451523 [Syncephalastrum racemosum]